MSIQALYDYKRTEVVDEATIKLFQFKHCTIISFNIVMSARPKVISIQALYDYKVI